jgi:hypothetical protein
MNSKLLIGSVVYGIAGIGGKVLAVEGDILTVETPKGTRTIPSSKVVKVETPDTDVVRVSIIPDRKLITKFKLGDRVKYIGSVLNLKTQYAGVLEIWEISKKETDSYACLKPNGRVTSWIEFGDLQLVEVA